MSLIFSKSCEYGVQAVLFLAKENRSEPIHLRLISDALRVPHHFLSKVLQTLSRDGIVTSHKGLYGGFELGRSPSNITLLNIVHSIEGVAFFDDCILGIGGCDERDPCPIHENWKTMKSMILDMLQNTSIHNLAEKGNNGNLKFSILQKSNQLNGTSMTPTEILKQEHRAIERMLNVLERAADRVAKGVNVPSQTFRNAIRFIQQFADKCHHGKEEDLLFPAMERRGFPRHAGPLAVMLNEHEAGRAHVRALVNAVELYEKNDPSSISQITEHAYGFASLLREHIMKEDNVLFVMAEQNLTAIDQNKLLADFHSLENSGETCRTKSELLGLLETMEREISN